MNLIVDSLAYWLADFYLAATVLLVAALVAMRACAQPAKRLAVAKAAIVAAGLLGVLCALPGWSVVSLGGVDATEVVAETPVAALPAVTPTNELPRFEEAAPIAPAAATLSRPAAAEIKWSWEVPWLKLLVAGYFVGCAAVALWLVAGVAAATRLVRRAEQFPNTDRDALRDVDGVGELLVSREIDVPVALGVFRPRVILPREWIETRSARELSTVLAHEAAHIRNGDLRWLAASRLLLVVLWAQPLYWWLRRQMRLDQETLADAAAAEVAGRQAYAEQLVTWARNVVGRPRPLLPASVGLWEGASQLRRRVAVLLDERFAVLPGWSLLARSAVVVTAGIAAIGLSLITLQPSSVSAESTESPRATEDGNGSLSYSGRVIDKLTGKPVAGATVTVRLQTSGAHPWKTLSATTRETSSDGRFEFTIPQELAADSHLYVELDVVDKDHAPLSGFGYALSMIRKNEKLGGRPFFDRIPLEPAATVAGTVRTPDGAPAAEMAVMAFSAAEEMPVGDFGHSWSRGKTDAQGTFRLNVVKRGKAILWLLPTEYAQQTHVLDARRGDLGTLKLENGIRLSGRVVNRQGEPIAGIWVNAELVDGPAKQPLDLPVVDSIRRSALTDADGKFELAPLPAGTYRVLPEENPVEDPRDDRQPRPLADVFLPQRVQLVAGQTPPPIDIRAVETVTIEGQIYDSAGKRRGGHRVDFFGRMGDEAGEYYFADGRPDTEGHIELRVPKGLRDAKLSLICNEHQALRYRWGTEGSLRSGREIELQDLQRDRRGLEIIYFTAPILIVRARDEQGKGIPEFKPAVFYEDSVKPRDTGTRWLSGISGEVGFERQADGRWRSEQLLPDEKFFVTVTADGYGPATKNLSLKEGVTREVDVTLRKTGSAKTPSDVEPDKADSANTSIREKTRHLSVGGGTVNSFVAGNPATPWDYEPNAVRLEVEDEAGEPVPGVEATLYSTEQSPYGGQEILANAMSDQAGVIELPGVVPPERAEIIRASLERGPMLAGGINFYLLALTKPGQGAVIFSASDVTIAIRGLKRRIRLRPAAALSGRVTDEEGKPVAGATVIAGTLGNMILLPGVNSATTDADGRYRLEQLVKFDRAAATRVTAEEMKQSIAARNMARLYPALYDAANDPTVSDLQVAHPEFGVTAVRGGDVPGETNVTLARSAVIEGQVLQFGTGLPGAGVIVQAFGHTEGPSEEDRVTIGSGEPLLMEGKRGHAATTITDADGKYRLANLPAGTYDVWAEHPAKDWREIDWVSTNARNLRPTPGQPALQAPNLIIGPVGTIRGRLVDAKTGEQVELADKNARVKAVFHFVDGENLQQPQVQEVPMADDGSFELKTFPVRLRVFVDARQGLQLTDSEKSEYRSPDDFYRSGQVFDLAHGDSVDAEFPVMSARELDDIRNEIQLGFESLHLKYREKAARAFSAALESAPKELTALAGRAQAYELSGQFAKAIGDYESLVELEPESPMWRNNLAFLLATSPNEADRDGARAVELAQRAVAQAGAAKLPAAARVEFLDTLAAAQAEAGDFEAAVKTQRAAMEKAGDGAKAEMQKRLAAYQAGKAWRREASVSVAK